MHILARLHICRRKLSVHICSHVCTHVYTHACTTDTRHVLIGISLGMSARMPPRMSPRMRVHTPADASAHALANMYARMRVSKKACTDGMAIHTIFAHIPIRMAQLCSHRLFFFFFFCLFYRMHLHACQWASLKNIGTPLSISMAEKMAIDVKLHLYAHTSVI